MPITVKEIKIRTSPGHGDTRTVPISLKKLALDLEAASPLHLFFLDSEDADRVNLRLIEAMKEKASQVETDYVFDASATPPGSSDSITFGHEIDPSDPAKWNPIGGGTRSVLYPITGSDGETYYVGFSVS